MFKHQKIMALLLGWETILLFVYWMKLSNVFSMVLIHWITERSGKLDSAFHMEASAGQELDARSAFKAWSCFIFIFILLLGTSKLVPPVNGFLAQFATTVTVFNGDNPGSLTFSWINTPGVWIFLAAFAGGLIQEARACAPWAGCWLPPSSR